MKESSKTSKLSQVPKICEDYDLGSSLHYYKKRSLSGFCHALSFATDCKLFTLSTVTYTINPASLLHFVYRTEIQCELNTSPLTL